MWFTVASCIALAAVPGLIAWPWRRRFPSGTDGGERARFMLDVGVGCSLLFTLVTVLSAVPVAWLDPCRT
jgi:hypothetical protein